ncbi:MAG: DUF4124 domain-containing protein [Gammaproteobacteria bacterium]
MVSLACASVLAATVYKWVDENGVTHYSDQPHPAAKIIELKGAQTYGASETPTPPSQDSEPSAATATAAYALCELYRPENDEVFLNTSTVTAKLRTNPQLRPGDRVAIALDGKQQAGQPTSGKEFVLMNVVRGTHQLMAVIQDSSGAALCTSPSVTFHVRQPSVQAPNRANRPRF